jgi:uncharacterized protein (TIGR03382 family)
MTSRHLASALATVLLSAGAGCGRDVHFDDDFDPAFDIDLSDANELHLPYATGTQVRIDLHNADDDDVIGWTFETSDPAVLRIDSAARSVRSVQLTAVAAGTAMLTLRDEDGDVIRRAEIEVATPDRVRLFARGPLRHGLDTLSRVERPQVVVDRVAVFEVRYFLGDRRVFGQEMLAASGSEAMELATLATSWESEAEWLEVRPFEGGTHEVALSAGAASLAPIEIVSVDPSVVAAVELHGREGDQRAGDSLTILATAYDAESEPVWGVPFTWSLDGAPVTGDGDIFTYTYDPASARELVLDANGASETTTIHAAADSASVGSSASVGCNAAGKNTAGWPVLAAIVALLGAAFRRR